MRFSHPIFRSRVGLVFAASYIVVGAIVTVYVTGCIRQGILPCDLPLGLVLLPAIPIMMLLEKLGVESPSFQHPGPYPSDVFFILLYLLFCSVLFYFIGFVFEQAYGLVRRLFRK